MKVIDILRILKKNLVLLIAIPVILVLLVSFFTRKPTYSYSSETTLFTGIASGSSVEMDKSLSFFATNTAFDNLINVIKSRETQQEVAIRLLAQHLMLEKYDSKYISRESFNNLRSITPAHILKLVVKNGQASLPISARDTAGVAVKFSFESLDTISMQLQPASIDKAAFDQTVRNLEMYMAGSDTNFVYKLLYFGHPHYSVKAISSVNVQRIASSDLVKLKYDSDDPGICQQTLILLTEVCLKNYKQIKENRSDAVVKYFEYQLKLAAERLKLGEDRLLKFNEDNNIINYYEQSKAVAVVKEDLDVDYNNKRIKLAGTKAAINRIEEKLGTQKQVQLKSSSIIEKRNQLSEVNTRIADAEVIGFGKTIDDKELVNLKQLSEKLKDDIRKSVNELYSYGNSTEGLPISSLLNDWITNVIDYEDTKAGIEVLGERIKEFQKQYAIYAPAGANLKRIEREISVSEQEFLEILHGLNLAKLKVQDAELSSSIKAVDPPFFPLSPIPTKRKILVMIAAVFGFLAVLTIILALEYFDETLKSLTRAMKIIQIKSAGVFPKILLKTGSVNFLFITNRLLEIIIQQIEQVLKTRDASGIPRTILFFSTMGNEGKTILVSNLARKLKKQGKKVVTLSFSRESLIRNEVEQIGYDVEPSKENNSGHYRQKIRFSVFSWLLGYPDTRIDYASPFLADPAAILAPGEYFNYQVNESFFNVQDANNLIRLNQITLNEVPDYLFIELPPVLYYAYPNELVSKADLAILVCRSNRTWSDADRNALGNFSQVHGHDPLLILNGVDLSVVNSVLGELPASNRNLKQIIKKIIRLQFYSRQQI